MNSTFGVRFCLSCRKIIYLPLINRIMQKLEGKVAFITGADSGIGKATAIEFAREGAHIVICYHRDRQGAEETLREVESTGRHGYIVQLDVSDEQMVEQTFNEAIAQLHTIDILVNNAGVNGSGIKVAEMETSVFDKTMKANLYGTFFCSRKFIRLRKGLSGRAKIINISSVHEEIVAPGNADYNASKAAIRNFTRTLALELAGEEINVNSIAPGMILTPMNQKALDDQDAREEQESHIPMKRAGNPSEIGRLAVFLASSDADYVTGSTYFMDGGLSLQLGQGA